MNGRAWAYAGALLGAGVSVAANVAHSYVPPAGSGPGWTPHAGAVVGAVFWPIALLVAIEVLARVPWPAAARWTVVRFGGLGPVALVAAVVSYRHLSGLLSYYGEDGITCTVGPLAVDGLMVMATGALLATSTANALASAATAAWTAPDTAVDSARQASRSRPADTAEVPEAPRKPTGKRPAASTPRRAPAPRVAVGADTAARVAALRGEGLYNAQIAAELGVSTRTVRRYAAQSTETATNTAADDNDMPAELARADERETAGTREGIPA